MTKVYMQVGVTSETKFIPHFNGEHVAADS